METEIPKEAVIRNMESAEKLRLRYAPGTDPLLFYKTNLAVANILYSEEQRKNEDLQYYVNELSDLVASRSRLLKQVEHQYRILLTALFVAAVVGWWL